MPSDSRLIKIADDAAELPENLLLAQSRGEVLFLAGAGVSRGAPACLPDFKTLARQLYEELDASVCPYLDDKSLPPDDLTPPQCAEVDRYHGGDFDVALGLLERRLDGPEATETSRVRNAVQQRLSAKTPTRLHRALSRLADRGNATAILTTNFDRLFERCTRRKNHPVPTYGLGGMPRPSIRADFSGIFHIHGVLPVRTDTSTDLVLTDRDFGEYYFRRRFIPDFLYDASRIYQLVLIGYSADDPPMQYLLNAIAADANRFHDIKRPYIFVPDSDARRISDLQGRGLDPITYRHTDDHAALTQTMTRWASISPRAESQRVVQAVVRRAVRNPAHAAPLAEVHLVSHLIKRGTSDEHWDLARIAGRMGHFSWLTTMLGAAIDRYPVDTVPRERAITDITTAFLSDRLSDADAVHWAATLDRPTILPHLPDIRRAVEAVLDRPSLEAPWSTAWGWIRDTWSARPGRDSLAAHRAAARLRAGDRSLDLANTLADLVKPPLVVRPVGHQFPRRKPKTVGDLLSISFDSLDFIESDKVDFCGVHEPTFLTALCHSLDSRLSWAVDMSRRFFKHQGWRAAASAFVVGLDASLPIRSLGTDPYGVGHGLGPLLEMLHRAVLRLADLDELQAAAMLRRWRHEPSFIHQRLWATLALNERVATGSEVGTFLQEIERHAFWDMEDFPEVSDLRAARFRHLPSRQQRDLLARIRVGPPRFPWLRHLSVEKFSEYQKRRTMRELRRILEGGGTLRKSDRDWMAKFEHIRPYPEKSTSNFDLGPAVSSGPEPDGKFDLLEETELLRPLEIALTEERGGRSSGEYGAAGAWVGEGRNWPRIIVALEETQDGGADYPHVWDCFGWKHRYPDMTDLDPEKLQQGKRVLELLDKRPLSSVGHDISGVSFWLSNWKPIVIATADAVQVALKYWPLAEDDTERDFISNGINWMRYDEGKRIHWDAEQLVSDALNTSAGRIAEVLAKALTRTGKYTPGERGVEVRRDIRKAIGPARGFSRNLSRYWLAFHVATLWTQQKDWTKRTIIDAMLSGGDYDLGLWMGFVLASSRQAFRETVEVLGDTIADRAKDPRLDTRTRRSLLVLVVRYFIFAFWNGWEPKLSESAARQMLRATDDESLAYVAHHAVLGFLDRGPSPEGVGDDRQRARAKRFRRAIEPLLSQIWPAERTVGQTALAKAMASVPAASGTAFSDSVKAVERFLVPFKVYSEQDYGFGEGNWGGSMEELIKTKDDAKALRHLLDRTVGEGEEARMPLDGDEILDRIRRVAPKLAKTPVFLRLKTLQRRLLSE